MDRLPELQQNRHWRLVIRALRIGYGALAIALVGLVVTLLGGSPWVLAIGAIAWLGAAVTLATGFLLTRAELPAPRPGFWSMRFTLIYDSVHAGPARDRS
jgi:hypothetical protein